MLRNGSYSAWFRTQRGEGTGIVELNDGKVTGGDTVLAYQSLRYQCQSHKLADAKVARTNDNALATLRTLSP